MIEHIWAGWRATFVPGEKMADDGCVLCTIGEVNDLDESLVVCRGEFAYVVLNLYPYTSGHLMVVPRRHIAAIGEVELNEGEEMLRYVRIAVATLEDRLGAQGINVGMNLGRPAGAGIADHIHVHVVPRWTGDANFMSTAASTRVLPEALPDTLAKLRSAWPSG